MDVFLPYATGIGQHQAIQHIKTVHVVRRESCEQKRKIQQVRYENWTKTNNKDEFA